MSGVSFCNPVQSGNLLKKLIMKKKLALGCIVPVVLIFGGCVAMVAGNAPPNAPQTVASGPAANNKNILVGTMTSVRADRALQVDRVELVDSLEVPYGEPLTAGTGKLAVVYFQVQNTGKESGSLVFSTYQLIDSQERKYAEITDFIEAGQVWSWSESQGLGNASKQLFPGETAPTAKVFRVAPDATGFSLTVNGKTFKTE
jgi:hypothetical protein